MATVVVGLFHFINTIIFILYIIVNTDLLIELLDNCWIKKK